MRAPREQSVADIYHVVARGTGRQIIFENDRDRMSFLRLMKKVFKEEGCELYAWCLMSNHVHLLIHAQKAALSSALRRVLGTYASGFNSRNGRVGHLFQERFASEPVNDDAYLCTVIRYIHQNPAKAGLASTEEYTWSSYSEYTRKREYCTTAFPLEVFGGVREFVRFHSFETNDSCLDVTTGRNASRSMPDECAREIAVAVLHPLRIEDLKSMEPSSRDKALAKLRKADLTVRQIERLTGIGRGIVQRAMPT